MGRRWLCQCRPCSWLCAERRQSQRHAGFSRRHGFRDLVSVPDTRPIGRDEAIVSAGPSRTAAFRLAALSMGDATAMMASPTSRYATFVSIATVGCAVDLATKSWIFAKLGMPSIGPRRNILWIWNGFIGLETSLNRGALFGMGQGKVWLFTVLSVAAAAGILYWLFFEGAVRNRILTVALGCAMAGILGNLYDRAGLWSIPGQPGVSVHAVRDWILLQFRGRDWPNFNVADSLLLCGAVLFTWHAFRHDTARVQTPATTAAAKAEATER